MKEEDKPKFVDCEVRTGLCFNGPGSVKLETPKCRTCKYNKNRNGEEDNWFTAGRM